MTHDLDQGEGAPRPAKRQKTSVAATTTLPPPPPPPTMCCICREPLKVQEVAVSCPYCRFGIFCRDCLHEWYIKATTDETRMPVKCCDVDIPAKKVKGLLTNEEIKLYEAKYEEWSTFDKMYCPVPQCSAFIPSKLYLLHSADKFEPVGSTTPKKKQAFCPHCRQSICTTCRGPMHAIVGKECTNQRADIDPVLEAKLKKWGVKRCPKCNAGVRLMYGCPHVRCRCSFSFCFGCLRAIEECEGHCGDGYHNAFPNDEDDDEVSVQDMEAEDDVQRLDAEIHVSRIGQAGERLPSLQGLLGHRPATEDKPVHKEDSDIDLDEGIGSELDLGSDPDEPQDWQCRHSSWSRAKVQGSGWSDAATVCNWCKTSVSERAKQDEAVKAAKKQPGEFKNTISDIIDPAPEVVYHVMICSHCGIRMCEECAKALNLGSK